ncbi:DUF4946 domain-containing protein [Pseudomonas sp. ZM23]|uniref:DUF4946 domain-containing protein n=1 Tax=Pseudomonas triclosanedens TaxID=2961893 RepID=A0ABY7A3P1_9PSED|nr:DUF4946 domain-containing protein [Pseudomonas triclosanedens]MCP8465000.1 DUF4946 domain-containing protein [Pseudomonas triclosanedens]MCP8470288.1 DUF4946 domain-containing protein [Pseudomonas triclosanedens]MCP8476093.1 DUF4946 domain-containing protein [Pseudomonas triclosanedens]WAI51674.1 DUF4946 domain-containing protein [Pseudomonas triclosanedens]
MGACYGVRWLCLEVAMSGSRSWLLLAVLFVSWPVLAEMEVHWPEGWAVTRSPEGAAIVRQRGVRLDESGGQAVVMEVTRSRLAVDASINVERVILEMRKALQKDFLRQGFEAACSKPKAAMLGGLDGLEVRCGISQNGAEVLKQSLQVAIGEGVAYSLTYAAPAERYPELKKEIESVKAGLRLN